MTISYIAPYRQFANPLASYDSRPSFEIEGLTHMVLGIWSEKGATETRTFSWTVYSDFTVREVTKEVASEKATAPQLFFSIADGLVFRACPRFAILPIAVQPLLKRAHGNANAESKWEATTRLR